MGWRSRGPDTDGARGSVPASAAPSARRLRRARLGDLRLWLGLALVVGSVVVGARVMSVDEATVVVLRATRDLAAGSVPRDLVPVRVNSTVAGGEYLSGQPPAGDVLRWPISAGELVPRSAIAAAADTKMREVTIPVDPLHAPPGLQSGDMVDVWSSPRENEPGAPVLVLPAVTVAAVAAEDVGLGGEIGVVLDVPAESVSAVVLAARSGVVDLVAVPLGSQVLAGVDVEAAGP